MSNQAKTRKQIKLKMYSNWLTVSSHLKPKKSIFKNDVISKINTVRALLRFLNIFFHIHYKRVNDIIIVHAHNYDCFEYQPHSNLFKIQLWFWMNLTYILNLVNRNLLITHWLTDDQRKLLFTCIIRIFT